MNSVEQRVVKMEFDNRLFEQNVNKSISTLDKLKKCLHMEGAAESFDEISEKAGKVDLNPLQKGVEEVKLKFSMLEYAAIAALTRVVDKAVDAGMRIAKSLTIEPIGDGYKEYELKMNSVQTMMMSTGESLETVNEYLNQLNLYADKTIYSFSDMTSNIGKFTNAGVSLKDAVAAIQGISNEAALSGANATEASHAMYNFAQALSSGAVKLIDWKSIENANMATVEFKNELIKTALELGTVVEAEGKYQSTTTDLSGNTSELFTATSMFNDSLSSQWMTTDVLTKTMARYSDETTEIGKRAFEAATKVKTYTQLIDTLKEAVGSGWAESFEIMIGDFNEARSFYTKVSDELGAVISDSAASRNDLLTKTFASGWKQVINEGVADAKSYRETVTQVARDHGVAVDDIIKRNGGFEESLKEGWLTSDMLKEGLARLTDKYTKMSAEELRATGYSKESIDTMAELNKKVQEGTVSFEKYNSILTQKSGRQLIVEGLANSFEVLKSVIKPVSEGMKEVFHGLHGEELYKLIQKITEFTAKLKLTDSESKNLKDTVKGVSSVLDILWQVFKKLVVLISPVTKLIRPTLDALLSFTGAIGRGLASMDKSMKDNSVFKNFNQTYLNTVSKAASFVGDAFKSTTGFVGSVIEFFKQIGSGVGSLFKGVFDSFAQLMSGNAFGITGNSKTWNAGIYFSKAFDLIGSALRHFKESVVEFTKDFNVLEFLKSLLQVISGLSLAKIIRNFSKSSKSFSGIFDNLKEATEKLPEVFESVTKSIDSFTSKTNRGMAKANSKILLTYAAAIGILALSLYELGKLDFEHISGGLMGLVGTMTTLVGGVKMLSRISGTMNPKELKGLATLTGTLITIANAVMVMSTAVKILGSLSWSEILKGITGVGALAAIMAGAARVMAVEKKTLIKGGTAMLSFAMAIKILSTAVKPLGEMDLATMGKGLLAIAGLCTEMVVTMTMVGRAQGKILKGTIAMQGISVALLMLIPVMKSFAGMDWAGIGKSLVTLGGSLVILCTAIHNLSKGTSLKGVLALQMMSVALLALVKPIKAFAELNLKQIGSALLTLGGSLAEMVIAVKMLGTGTSLKGVLALDMMASGLKTLAPVLKTFSEFSLEGIGKSLLMLGGALAELGIALKLIHGNMAGATSLLVIATAINVLAVGLGAFSMIGFENIVKSLIALAGALGTIGVAAKLLQPLNGAILQMSLSMTAFSGAAALFGIAMVLVGDGIDRLMSVSTAKIKGFLQMVNDIIPILANIITGLIVGVCDIITNSAGPLVTAIYTVIHELLDKVTTLIPEICRDIVIIIDEILKALAEHTPSIMNSVMEILVGFIQAIADHAEPLAKALGELGRKLFGQLISSIKQMDPDEIIKLTGAAAIMTAFMVAMSALKELIPSAMIGLAEFGVFIAEFMAILALMGGVYSNPDLKWMISEGSDAMAAIGRAIGRFVGSIAGGIGEGVTSSLPNIGRNLSDFMIELKPFIEISKDMDMKGFEALASLAGVLTMLTGQKIMNGLTAWFTGGVSLSSFSEDLRGFGRGMKMYADSVKDIDPDLITKSANAAKVISELANGLPKKNGMVQMWTGQADFFNDFIVNIAPLGDGIKKFGEAVKGIDPNAVVNSTNAAKVISELAHGLPKTGGLKTMWDGVGDMAHFSRDLGKLGTALKEYSDNINGLNPEVVVNSTNAAKTLNEFANGLPPKSGLKQLWEGSSNLSAFARELRDFGPALKAYAESVTGLDPNIVVNSTNAAKAISEFAAGVPNVGGLKVLWEGDNDLISFANQIKAFGPALKEYADSVKDLDPNIVINSANAAKVISEFATSVPNIGGLKVLWEGDNDLISFANQIKAFGPALKEYADSVTGLDAGVVENSANAAKTISAFASEAPKFGGVKDFWGGSVNLSWFGDEIKAFGPNLKAFSDSVVGLDANVVTNAASAAKTVSEFAAEVPKFGAFKGIWEGNLNLEWFGEELKNFGPALKGFADSVVGLDTNVVANAGNAAKTVSSFAAEVPKFAAVKGVWDGNLNLAWFGDELKAFGPKLKEFGDSVTGLDPNVVTNASNSAKSLAEFVKVLPKEDGVVQAWEGNQSLGKFAEQLALFGPSFKSYADSVAGIDPNVVINSTNAAKSIGEFVDMLPKTDGVVQWWEGSKGLKPFGEQLDGFGTHLKIYCDTMKDVDWTGFDTSIANIKKLIDVAQLVKDLGDKAISDIGQQMMDLGDTGVKEFIRGFKDAYDDVTSAGGEMIDKLVKGVDDNVHKIESKVRDTFQRAVNIFGEFAEKFRTVGKSLIDRIESGVSANSHRIQNAVTEAMNSAINGTANIYNNFHAAGENLVAGFVDGMNSNEWRVSQAADDLAQRALDQMKSTLDEHSPSKKTHQYGEWFVEGFMDGINKYGLGGDTAARNMVANFSNDMLDAMYNSLLEHPVNSYWQDQINAFYDGLESQVREAKRRLDLTPAQASMLHGNLLDELQYSVFRRSDYKGAKYGKDYVREILKDSKDAETAAKRIIDGLDPKVRAAFEHWQEYCGICGEAMVNHDAHMAQWQGGVTECGNMYKALSSDMQLEVDSLINSIHQFGTTGSYQFRNLEKAIDDLTVKCSECHKAMTNCAIDDIHVKSDMDLDLNPYYDGVAQMEGYNPVITPVLNLDEVYNGMQEMEEVIYDREGAPELQPGWEWDGDMIVNRDHSGEPPLPDGWEYFDEIIWMPSYRANNASQSVTDNGLPPGWEYMEEVTDTPGEPMQEVAPVFNITNNITETRDARATADAVSKRIQHQVERKKAAWG